MKMATAYNRRISGYGFTPFAQIRPIGRISDTRQPLSEIDALAPKRIVLLKIEVLVIS
jgi:hypothetical protein